LDVRKKTIETLQATKNQSKTAFLLRLSFDQVNRVMRRAVVRGLTRRDPDEVYENLSFDEKSVGRGHDYITVLSDSRRAIVIDVEVGRTKESVSKLCTKSLSNKQREKVKTVSTDMWDAYIYGAKTYFPNALHSYDNFHLVGYLNTRSR
jgi:transposase